MALQTRTFENSCNGTYGSKYRITLEVVENSIDIVNNTSNITITVKCRSTNSSYGNYGYTNPTRIYVDGTEKAYNNPTTDYRKLAVNTLCTWTGDITHDSAGNKRISVSASFTSTSSSLSGGSVSGDVDLTTIPRASQITVADANIGSSTNITINKTDSNFTTTLYYKASGENSWTKIVDKTSNQVYGWTVPTSFYALIPNNKTISCEFYAETYSGDTLIGTSNTITATFTATGNPVINSITTNVMDTKTVNLTGSNSKMIRYVSLVQVNISTIAQNSSSISSVTVNGVTASGALGNYMLILRQADTNTFNVVVTDSRGYTTEQTQTMTMVDYIPLTINASISRNAPTDGKINISFSGNYFNDTFGSLLNNLTVQYRSIVKGDSWSGISWNDLTTTISDNTYTGNAQLTNYDYTNQYEFQIKATDRIGTVVIEGIDVLKGIPTYWWDDDGLYVNGDFKINNENILDIFYPVGSIYTSTVSTNPETFLGGTWTSVSTNPYYVWERTT